MNTAIKKASNYFKLISSPSRLKVALAIDGRRDVTTISEYVSLPTTYVSRILTELAGAKVIRSREVKLSTGLGRTSKVYRVTDENFNACLKCTRTIAGIGEIRTDGDLCEPIRTPEGVDAATT